MSDIIFQNQYFFYLLPLLVIIIYFLFKQLKYGYNAGFLKDLQKIYGTSNKAFYINILIISLIFILYILILAKPVVINQKESIKKNGIDISLLFDLSYSMIATDLKPNRLDVAKEVILNFTNKLKTDRLGLIVFSGKPFTRIPLTFDYEILTEAIEKIDISNINQNYRHLQGTAIGDAILMGVKNYEKEDKNREKIMILLTDGEANRGINPIDAVRFSKDQNIKIYTIGIGGIEDTTIKISDNRGGLQELKIGGIDEKSLKTIADSTGGKYFRATNKKDLESIFETISLLEKKDIEVENTTILKEKYHLFLYLLIFFFSIHLYIRKNNY